MQKTMERFADLQSAMKGYDFISKNTSFFQVFLAIYKFTALAVVPNLLDTEGHHY
jgi:hypothetical protein